MKRLSKVVNIVPVIAKADTLTLEERIYFKQRVGSSAFLQPPAPSSWGTEAAVGRGGGHQTPHARLFLKKEVQEGWPPARGQVAASSPPWPHFLAGSRVRTS